MMVTMDVGYYLEAAPLWLGFGVRSPQQCNGFFTLALRLEGIHGVIGMQVSYGLGGTAQWRLQPNCGSSRQSPPALQIENVDILCSTGGLFCASALPLVCLR